MSRDVWLLMGALLVGAVLTGVLQVVFPDAKWWKLVLAALLLLLLGLRRWRDRQA